MASRKSIRKAARKDGVIGGTLNSYGAGRPQVFAGGGSKGLFKKPARSSGGGSKRG